MICYVISFPVFYGLFAFSDYENWDCYALQDHSVTTPWMGDPNDVPGDYHNVSANFYMVNLWGFINFVAPPGIFCFFLCCSCIFKGDMAEILASLAGCLVGISFFGHLFTMLVMRWRHAGRVCSGDYNSEL